MQSPDWSNYGSAVDILAPGTNVLTTDTAGVTSTPLAGTSVSSPLVAGVAALILEEDNNLTLLFWTKY